MNRNTISARPDGQTGPERAAREQFVARAICARLDQGAAGLPNGIADRLAAARLAAVARSTEIQTSRATAIRRPVAASGRNSTHSPFFGMRRAGWRLGAAVVPVLVLVGGVILAASTTEDVRDEAPLTADAAFDSSFATEEVPLVAYADRGFGVYMRNTSLASH